MSIKLLAFDLDGTLLRKDKTVDPRTIEAIKKAMDAGIHVALATGRDKNGCQFVIDQLGLDKEGRQNYLALVNGQMIYDFQNKEYDLDDVLNADDGLRIQAVCAKYGVEGIFCCGYDFYSYLSRINRIKKNIRRMMNGKSADYGLAAQSEKRNFIDLDLKPYIFTQDINKVCLIKPGPFFAENLEKMSAELPEYQMLMVGPEWVEIMPKGVSKASALEKIAERIGCSMNEVMAFGDAENDMEMIQKAGLGVAMGNGMDILKDNADLVTDTNMNNGIGKAIDALLAGQEDLLRQGILPEEVH
ncbi:MAG: HAD family phosphatase [Erysipelotrichaceae bacterium]|nr:HAD family phosphatase [Erysipelotrichaceae bacterium]